MSPLLAIIVPLVGALLIVLAGRYPNLRETMTLGTAVTLAGIVLFGIAPGVVDGGRPSVTLAEPLPGISLGFTVEPLGLLFASIASLLWIINSIYSIGYMRGNQEKHQTRFY